MTSFARERRAPSWLALWALGLAFILVAPAAAQTERTPPDVTVTPEIKDRSDDLDVPFVPSPDGVLTAMFEMAKPTSRDFVIDLGSGDGRIVIAAAHKFGARGFGVDLNAGLVSIANNLARRAGVADRAKFHVRNLFDTDVRQASLLTMYLLPEIVEELRPKLLAELRPGARIVSHDYHMGVWRPDEIRHVENRGRNEDSVVYFWTVPAKVSGAWEWEIAHAPRFGPSPIDYRVLFDQTYQDLDGRIEINYGQVRLVDAKLVGRRIAFSGVGEINERLIRHDFEGIVEGDSISGTVRLSGGVPTAILPWTARRAARAD